MIEFIIYDEIEKQRHTYNELIDKVMINYDVEYTVSYIKSYDSSWENLAEKNTFKIYILDVKSRKESGIDIAKYIRENLNDWQSMIILVSEFQEYKYELTKYRLMILDYIDRNDSNYFKRLLEAIHISLNNYDSRPKTLKYNYKNIHYNIELSKIIYIEKEPESKRCVIKTNVKDFYSSGNLRQLEQKLDKRFFKCSRSYIINIEQVEQYNIKNNLITFRNKEQIADASLSKKKELIERLRGL